MQKDWDKIFFLHFFYSCHFYFYSLKHERFLKHILRRKMVRTFVWNVRRPAAVLNHQRVQSKNRHQIGPCNLIPENWAHGICESIFSNLYVKFSYECSKNLYSSLLEVVTWLHETRVKSRFLQSFFGGLLCSELQPWKRWPEIENLQAKMEEKSMVLVQLHDTTDHHPIWVNKKTGKTFLSREKKNSRIVTKMMILCH